MKEIIFGLEMVGCDGHESEIELRCKLEELIMIIGLMMWWVGLLDLVMLFGLKRLKMSRF